MPDAFPTPLEAFSTALADAVSTAAASVVSIGTGSQRYSGFAWRPDLIVTADEALGDDAKPVILTSSGEERSAKIVGRDPTTDIALLRIDGATFPPVTFSSAALRTGELAIAVGGGPVAALGVVSSAGPSWHSTRGGAIDARIELDLQLRRRAEGSLVVNAAGLGLGMAVLGPRQRTLVIPSATIDRVGERLAREGRIPRGYLGLALQPVRIAGSQTMGAMVLSVDSNGPGSVAGFHQGDVIVSWDRHPVGGVGHLSRALGPDSVGRSVTCSVRRGGASIELALTIGERPHG